MGAKNLGNEGADRKIEAWDEYRLSASQQEMFKYGSVFFLLILA